MLNTNTSVVIKLKDRDVNWDAHFEYKTDRSVIQKVKKTQDFYDL